MERCSPSEIICMYKDKPNITPITTVASHERITEGMRLPVKNNSMNVITGMKKIVSASLETESGAMVCMAICGKTEFNLFFQVFYFSQIH